MTLDKTRARTGQDRWRGLVRLSRWQEHISYTVPLTLLGAIMAVESRTGASLDAHVITVTLANVLAVTVAFMVNDIEDAPDDAREAARAARNPVTCGEITPREGWLASFAVTLVALALYAWASQGALWIGAITLALSYLYSWRGVRLKARPVVDVLSHVLMLSALLFLAGYFAYDTAPGGAWLVALALALVSAYGQLYNQLRDFEMDRAAGLHNTASIVGFGATRGLMYGSVALALALLIVTIVLGLWPAWLALVPLLMAPLFFVFRPSTDARGSEAIDPSGRLQTGFLIVANVAVLVWLAAVLIG